MTKPQKKQITFEDFQKTFAQKPAVMPKLTDWETAYQNIYGPDAPRTPADSVEVGLKMTPYQEQQLKLSQDREARAKAKHGVDYKKSLLDLQEKERKAKEGKIEDLDRKEKAALKRYKAAYEVVSKTKTQTKYDEEGDPISEVKVPYYSREVREFEEKRAKQYADSLRIIDLTKLMRQQNIAVNTSEVRRYFKERSSNIDGVVKELIKKGLSPREAVAFRETSMAIANQLITEALEGGVTIEDPYGVAMRQAAAKIELLYPDKFKRK